MEVVGRQCVQSLPEVSPRDSLGTRGINGISVLTINRNFSEEFEGLAERERQGKAVTCFMTEFKRLGRDKLIDYESMVFLAGSLVEAGSDTTRVVLNQLVAATALFPETVARARKELDEVCGADGDRLPLASDLVDLPYIKAAAKEALRWK